jgi:hypothetical protein
MSAPPLEKTAATPRTECKSLLPDAVAAALANGGGKRKENVREDVAEESHDIPEATEESRDVGIEGPSAPNGAQPADKFPPGPSEILPNPLIEGMDPENIETGVLIPLKTVLEVQADHTVLQAYITRAPTKCASDVMEYVLVPSYPRLPRGLV